MSYFLMKLVSALIFMTLKSSICLTFTRSLKKRSRNEQWDDWFYHQLNVPSLLEINTLAIHPFYLLPSVVSGFFSKLHAGSYLRNSV